MLLDGERAREHLRSGESQSFSVSTGKHRVWVRIDRIWGSGELAVDLGAGEVVRLECAPRSAWRVFDIFRPSQYVNLHRI